jgi:hypothetical protein
MPRELLSIPLILSWADNHRAQTGAWPTRTGGVVLDCPGERWNAINDALRHGLRGLPGGTTLARLLAQRRGARNRTDLPALTVEQIIVWARAHHARTGRWPTRNSGPVHEEPGQTWYGIDRALREGQRGLGRGSSLVQLLAAQVGKQNHLNLPRLTVAQILAWADAHHARTGQWPSKHAGAVAEAPGEKWSALHDALRTGCRGLPGGTTLYRLLRQHRQVKGRRPPLRVENVRAGQGRAPIRINLQPEHLAEVRAGQLTPARLARRCRVSLPVVLRELRRLGVQLPAGRQGGAHRPAWEGRVVREYRQGRTIRQIAQGQGRDTKTVRRALIRNGVARRSSGPVPFAEGLTPEGRVHLGLRVRALRLARGLSLSDVLALSGVSPTTIIAVEAGQRTPTRRTMQRLSEGLGVSLHAFRAEKPLDVHPRRVSPDPGGTVPE